MEFDKLNIDSKIKNGIRNSGLTIMTEIQAKVIPVALEGHDIIGSSQTVTGKTLAFIIPLLQKLLDLKWNTEDGLGGLILTPTHELALQIFNVLSCVGKYTRFSVGLVMGGLETENEIIRISGMNILVCTPGRLLQHLCENPYFNARDVQVLVLDEADKMMEMGFKESLVDILEYIQEKRQTLLFSATPRG